MATKSEKMALIRTILNDLHREHDDLGEQIDYYVREGIRIRDMAPRDFEAEFNDDAEDEYKHNRHPSKEVN